MLEKPVNCDICKEPIKWTLEEEDPDGKYFVGDCPCDRVDWYVMHFWFPDTLEYFRDASGYN